MSEEYKVSYEDHIAQKNSIDFVKWMCVSILSVLAIIFVGMATAVIQNNQLRLEFTEKIHLLRLEFVLLDDAVKDHIKEQKEANYYISSMFADYDGDEKEKERRKKTYVANSDE